MANEETSARLPDLRLYFPLVGVCGCSVSILMAVIAKSASVSEALLESVPSFLDDGVCFGRGDELQRRSVGMIWRERRAWSVLALTVISDGV